MKLIMDHWKPNRVSRPVAQIGLATLLVLLLGAPSLVYPFGRDQGEYATIATEMLRGKVVYRDVFNVKPPATHLVHALSLALFGHSMLSIRILDLLSQVATALVILSIGTIVTRRWSLGMLAAAVNTLWYYSYDFWDTAQTDGWQTLPVALAVLAYLHAREHDRPWAYFACGAGIGVGVLFKYPIGILAPLLMMPPLWHRGRSGWRSAVLVGSGLCIPIVLCAAVLGAQGALGPFILSQTRYISSYTGGRSGPYGYFGMLWRIFRWLSWPTLALWLGAVLALVGLLGKQRNSYERTTLPVVLWFVAATVSYLSQAKGFSYHGLPLLAPLAVLSGRMAADVVEKGHPKWGRLAAVTILEVALLLPCVAYGQQIAGSGVWNAVRSTVAQGRNYGQIARTSRVAESAKPGFSFLAQYEAAEHIASSTLAGDHVFVWGFEPTIYFLAERPPASRFLYNLILYGDWSWPELRVQLIADLAAHPPAYIVVASDDASPAITGSSEDSATALRRFAALRAIIDEQYVHEVSFENLALYRRLQ